MIDENQITGVVLAGGLGRRMGEQDKGLVVFNKKPLIEHIITSLQPQCASLIINANRNIDTYSQYGFAVASDLHSGFQGPLAGIAASMRACNTEWIITVPCDGPHVHKDYVERMRLALLEGAGQIAVARDQHRLQPVYALISADLVLDLEAYLRSGERKIDRWYQQYNLIEVDFSYNAAMFENFNTPEQLNAALQRKP